MTLWPNNSIWLWGLQDPSHEFLARLKVPGMSFLLWSSFKSIRKLLKMLLLHQQTCLARLLVILAFRIHSWKKMILDFSPQTASKTPSNTMKASQQGRTLKVRTTCISPCPVIKVCDVFRNKVLPSSFGWWPRAETTAYNIHSPSLPKILFSVWTPTPILRILWSESQSARHSGMGQGHSPPPQHLLVLTAEPRMLFFPLYWQRS